MQQIAPPTVSPLARLLANEDITVMVDPSSKTASFDTQMRVLRLPEWVGMTSAQYSMLIGHECAHALWTPADKWMAFVEKWKRDPWAIAHLNIVEDARIERMMKSKYPGLRKDFAIAYREFHTAGLFVIPADEKVELVDRINQYYKIGFITPIKFSESECEWLRRIDAAATIDDSIQIAEDLLGGYEAQEQGDMAEVDVDGGLIAVGGTPQPRRPCTAHDDEKIRATDKCCDGHYQRDASNSYIIPEFVEEQVVLTWDRVKSMIAKSDIAPSLDILAGIVEENENDFRPNVSFMANRFNQRKAADEHLRTDTSRSGSLDTNRLVWYKTEDDLFKRVETIRTGKDHGFVMLLDWSGSMGGNRMNNTFWQTYEFCLFLRRVGVPFRVYAFTSYPNALDEANRNEGKPVVSPTTIHRDIAQVERYVSMGMTSLISCDDQCTLMEVMSSDMSVSDMRRAAAFYSSGCGAIYPLIANRDIEKRWGGAGREVCGFASDHGFSLSGTPLVPALAMMPQMIRAFQSAHPHQITNFVLLSDGEGGGVFRNSNRWSRENPCPTIKDLRTGYTFIAEPDWSESSGYSTLVDIVRRLTNATCSCFFVDAILRPYGFSSFGVESAADIDQANIRKIGGCVMPSTVWDEFFFLKAGSDDRCFTDLDAMNPTSIRDVRTHMSKQAKAQTKSRFVLGRFIDRISGSVPRPKRNKKSAAA